MKLNQVTMPMIDTAASAACYRATAVLDETVRNFKARGFSFIQEPRDKL